MSDPVNNFKGPNDWNIDSSRNAGRSQAEQNKPSSVQQPTETWASFQARQAAYDATKRQG